MVPNAVAADKFKLVIKQVIAKCNYHCYLGVISIAILFVNYW